MYIKVILENIKKNLKDYVIYFVTLAIVIGIFYSFNAIQSQKALGDLSITMSIFYESMNKYIMVLSVALAIIMAFLIVYANQFILKRRKKELGIYFILGMKKKRVSSILVGEIFIIGLVALIVGLTLGVGISQVLSVICIKMFQANVEAFEILFSVQAMKKTIIYFGIIYIIVILMNIRNISKLKLIDLILANRKNERFDEYNKKVYIGMFVLAVGILGIIGYMVYYSTSILKLNIGLVMLLITISTMLLFFSITSVVIIFIKQKSSIYYKKLNMFVLRQMGSKLQSNFISMTVVTILLMLTICIISTGISIALTMNENAKEATPYDMSVIVNNTNTEDMDVYQRVLDEDIPLNKYLKSWTQITQYSSEFKYRDLFLGKEIELWGIDKNIPDLGMIVVLVSDYNKALKLQGVEEISLNDNEFLINCNYKGTRHIVENFMNAKDSITIDNITLKLRNKVCLTNTITLTGVGNNDRGTIIVPDSMKEHLKREYDILLGQYNEGVVSDEVVSQLGKLVVDLSKGFRYNTKSMMYEFYYGGTALISFLCCYIGFVFLLICVALLALQQLCQTTDNIYRYGMLRKLGATPKIINKALFKQVSTYFFMPLVIGGGYSLVGIKKMIEIVESFLNMNIAVNMIFTIIVFLVIYGTYFIITYLSCKRIVKEN